MVDLAHSLLGEAASNNFLAAPPCAIAADEDPDQCDDTMDISSLGPLEKGLFEAVNNDNVNLAMLFIAKGADVNMITTGCKHLLFFAIMKVRDPEIINLLLRAGADVHYTDATGNRVMHFWARAARARNELLTIGEALVMAGAAVNVQRHTDGMTPLHLAAVGHNGRRGWLDFHKAACLVRWGASTQLKTWQGQLPLHLVNVNQRAATQRLCERLMHDGIIAAKFAQPTCNQAGCRWCI